MVTGNVIEKLKILSAGCKKLGFSEEAERIEQRLKDFEEPLLVMVVGEGKFGKSTLINELAGKKIAPVSKLPKTWKIDIYIPTKGEEEAWLYWKSRPESHQAVSIDEAIQICDEEERKAIRKMKEGQSWKSDLYQVKWFRHVDWPDGNVALVDTPGFSQLRSDSVVETVKLFGSDGIQLAVSDPFEYYYYRSDVVLWCIRADKLGDRDTLEALEKVKSQRKKIVGILTHMDKVPESRWKDILDQAARIHGEYVEVFLPSALGGSSSLRNLTVENLKAFIEREFISRSSELKEGVLEDFYNDEVEAFLSRSGSIVECWAGNIKRREEIKESVRKEIVEHFSDLKRDMSHFLNDRLSRLKSSLGTLWDRAGGNIEAFVNLVASEVSDLDGMGRFFEESLREGLGVIEGKIAQIVEDNPWEGVVLSSSVGGKGEKFLLGYKSFAAKDRMLIRSEAISNEVRNSLREELGRFSNMGEEPLIGGLFGAAVGGFLLGPLGAVLGGFVGLFFGSKSEEKARAELSQIEKECIDKVSRAIEDVFSRGEEKINEFLEEIEEDVCRQAIDHVSQSFYAFLGMTEEKMLEYTLSMDELMSSLDVIPEEYTVLEIPKQIQKSGGVGRLIYSYLIGKQSPVLGGILIDLLLDKTRLDILLGKDIENIREKIDEALWSITIPDENLFPYRENVFERIGSELMSSSDEMRLISSPGSLRDFGGNKLISFIFRNEREAYRCVFKRVFWQAFDEWMLEISEGFYRKAVERLEREMDLLRGLLTKKLERRIRWCFVAGMNDFIVEDFFKRIPESVESALSKKEYVELQRLGTDSRGRSYRDLIEWRYRKELRKQMMEILGQVDKFKSIWSSEPVSKIRKEVGIIREILLNELASWVNDKKFGRDLRSMVSRFVSEGILPNISERGGRQTVRFEEIYRSSGVGFVLSRWVRKRFEEHMLFERTEILELEKFDLSLLPFEVTLKDIVEVVSVGCLNRGLLFTEVENEEFTCWVPRHSNFVFSSLGFVCVLLYVLKANLIFYSIPIIFGLALFVYKYIFINHYFSSKFADYIKRMLISVLKRRVWEMDNRVREER